LKQPFQNESPLAIINCRYTIPDHHGFSEGLVDLLRRMLVTDISSRPTSTQVREWVELLQNGMPLPPISTASSSNAKEQPVLQLRTAGSARQINVEKDITPKALNPNSAAARRLMRRRGSAQTSANSLHPDFAKASSRAAAPSEDLLGQGATKKEAAQAGPPVAAVDLLGGSVSALSDTPAQEERSLLDLAFEQGPIDRPDNTGRAVTSAGLTQFQTAPVGNIGGRMESTQTLCGGAFFRKQQGIGGASFLPPPATAGGSTTAIQQSANYHSAPHSFANSSASNTMLQQSAADPNPMHSSTLQQQMGQQHQQHPQQTSTMSALSNQFAGMAFPNMAGANATRQQPLPSPLPGSIVGNPMLMNTNMAGGSNHQFPSPSVLGASGQIADPSMMAKHKFNNQQPFPTMHAQQFGSGSAVAINNSNNIPVNSSNFYPQSLSSGMQVGVADGVMAQQSPSNQLPTAVTAGGGAGTADPFQDLFSQGKQHHNISH